MKKIAIIADGWKKNVNYAWIGGCRQYIKEHDKDITMHFFNSFGNYSLDEKYNMGEYNIVRLPDLTNYDGIIVELTNVEDKVAKQNILDLVKASGVPAISLLEDFEGLYFVGTDNYGAMGRITEHMIVEHGCRTINYVAGPADNYENIQRIRGFKDTLAKHGIAYEEQRFYQDDFEIKTGEEAFAHFYEQNLLPEAFICANDNIAVGVCHAAKEKGLRVPEDFLVSGYDNFDKASYYSPRITTVGLVREQVSYLAMEVLDRIWSGEQVERVNLLEPEYIFQDSCGCKTNRPDERGAYVVDRIMSEAWAYRVSGDLLLLKRHLINCTSFEEMAACIPEYLDKLEYDEFYIMLNQEIADCNELPQIDGIGEGEYRTEGYPGHMDVMFARRGEQMLQLEGKKPGELIPGGEQEERCLYVFAPLHFRDREVGYVAFKDADYLLHSQMLFELMNVLEETMENLYHRVILSKMNRELSNLYIRDSLTGMYNRMAYQKLAVPLFERCKNNGESLMIMFVDLDRLKYINDTFGHDMGNVAIRAVANSIMQCCTEGIAMRYGGDEFVVMVPGYDNGKASRLEKKIAREIAMKKSVSGTEFEISASMGYVVVEDYSINLNDYINLADERMYEAKKKRRLQRE